MAKAYIEWTGPARFHRQWANGGVFDLNVNAEHAGIVARLEAFIQQPVGLPQDLLDKARTVKPCCPVGLADEGTIEETLEAEPIDMDGQRGADSCYPVAWIAGDHQQLVCSFVGIFLIRQGGFGKPETDNFFPD